MDLDTYNNASANVILPSSSIHTIKNEARSSDRRYKKRHNNEVA
ncbi:unnamed protein product, partial [Rotaria magnacalcarata]